VPTKHSLLYGSTSALDRAARTAAGIASQWPSPGTASQTVQSWEHRN